MVSSSIGEEDIATEEAASLPRASSSLIEPVPLTPLLWGAQLLRTRFGQKVGRITESAAGVDAKQVSNRLHAAAQAAVQAQRQSLKQVFDYVQKLTHFKQWRPVAFVEHTAYDETQLELRVQFEGQDQSEKQVARTHVVEHSWTIIVERLPASVANTDTSHLGGAFCVFHGQFGASVRVSEDATGETISKVLKSVWNPHCSFSKTFPICLRLAETDECGANLRAESLLLKDRRDSGDDWLHCHVVCLPHKAHSAAVRTWALVPGLISSLVHSCKWFNQGGSMAAFNEVLAKLIESRLRVVHMTPVYDEDADAFKKSVFSFFSPSLQHPQKRSVISAAMKFFNADWRQKDLLHFCSGAQCCANERISLLKGIIFATKMARSLRPPVFSRSSWTAWSSSLHWYGLATSFHQGLFLQAARIALEQKQQQEPSVVGNLGDIAPVQDVPDAIAHSVAMPDTEGAVVDNLPNETEQYREEQAKTRRVALDFFTSDPRALFRQVWLLRIPLEPQRVLMQRLTTWTSAAWEEEQLMNFATTGTRLFRPLELHRQAPLHEFFRSVMSQFCDQTLWQWFPQTEQFRSDLLKMSMKSAAMVFQLISLRVSHLPFKLFILLDRDETLDTNAKALLDVPVCLRDSFSQRFLSKYNTVTLLKSNEVWHLLFAIATQWLSTTYSTERIHSKNLRRAKSRALTHRIHVQDASLPHMAFSGPAFIKKETPQLPSKPRGRPRKRAGDDAEESRPSKQRRPGGAWRAFLNKELGGRQFNQQILDELKNKYRSLSPETKARFIEIGRAGLLFLFPLGYIKTTKDISNGTFFRSSGQNHCASTSLSSVG